MADTNQCDWCRAGMELSEGKHYDRHGFVVMVCQAHRYAEQAHIRDRLADADARSTFRGGE